MNVCGRCGEPITEHDDVETLNDGAMIMHRNCFMRTIVGSVAHIEKRCRCYVEGSEEGDDPKLTKRQAADAAVAAFYAAEENRGPCLLEYDERGYPRQKGKR